MYGAEQKSGARSTVNFSDEAFYHKKKQQIYKWQMDYKSKLSRLKPAVLKMHHTTDLH